MRGSDLASSEVAAIDVARCLVRGPDTLIVEHAFADLAPAVAEEAVARLRRALVGRGLIVVLRELSGHMDTPPFDAVVRLDRGVATVENRRRSAGAASADAAVPEPVA